MQTLLEHSKTKQAPIFVQNKASSHICPFLKTQISSQLLEISLKLTIICYINLIKSITIMKK